MSRFFAPIALTVAISGLALTLIAIVIARSPYTHGNLSSPAGYTRTQVTYVGQDYPWEGMPLKNPAQTQTGDAVSQGGLLFFQYGCASCHGFTGHGGTVGKDLSGKSANNIRTKVREGPKTMPAFPAEQLSDADLQKITAFLQSAAP